VGVMRGEGVERRSRQVKWEGVGRRGRGGGNGGNDWDVGKGPGKDPHLLTWENAPLLLSVKQVHVREKKKPKRSEKFRERKTIDSVIRGAIFTLD